MSSKSNSESVSSAEFDLKHRVTGAAVLLFLGALVLPWLLGPPSEANKVELASEASTVSEIEPADIISNDVQLSGKSIDDVEETVYISKITPLDAKGNSELREAAERAADSTKQRSVAAGANTQDNENLALLAIANEEQQKLDKQKQLELEQEKRGQEELDKNSADEVAKKNALADGKDGKEVPQSAIEQTRAQQEKELQAALAAETESLKASANKVDVGWVVQVGLFTEKNRALALISELKRKGFTASSSVVDTNRGKNTGTRVWLGPFAKRVAAIDEQNRLKAKAAKDGFIRVYP